MRKVSALDKVGCHFPCLFESRRQIMVGHENVMECHLSFDAKARLEATFILTFRGILHCYVYVGIIAVKLIKN